MGCDAELLCVTGSALAYIQSADNPVEVLNEHLSLLVGRDVQTKINSAHKDKPLFDDQCRRAFGIKKEANLRWTRDRSRVITGKSLSDVK